MLDMALPPAEWRNLMTAREAATLAKKKRARDRTAADYNAYHARLKNKYNQKLRRAKLKEEGE